MEVQSLNLVKVRKCYERYHNTRALNILVARVINDIVVNGAKKDFKWPFFKNITINFNYLKQYEEDTSKNLEELLYQLVLNEAEPREKIINMALRKCKWNYLIALVSNGYISIENYEKQIILSLPNVNYEALFKVPNLNINKLKRIIYDDLREENFCIGYYYLLVLFLVNTECDKYNIAFAKKLVSYKNDDLNYLLLDVLKYYLKNTYHENILKIEDIFVNNYDNLVQERPDILLVYVEFSNRMLREDSTMKVIYENYVKEEERKIKIEDIAKGKEKLVALYMDEGLIDKGTLNYIVNCWLKNNNSLALNIYLEYILSGNFDYENVGEKLDQQYVIKSNERILRRKKEEK